MPNINVEVGDKVLLSARWASVIGYRFGRVEHSIRHGFGKPTIWAVEAGGKTWSIAEKHLERLGVIDLLADITG